MILGGHYENNYPSIGHYGPVFRYLLETHTKTQYIVWGLDITDFRCQYSDHYCTENIC